MTTPGEDPEALRRRLDEAEDTLRAIRQGEVDALVVGDGEGDRVFALVGGTESYRAFMEAMDLGAAALDGDRRLLYANAALCSLLGTDVAELQERGLLDLLDAECAGAVRALIDHAGEGRQSAEVQLGCDGRKRHLLVTVTRLPLSFSQGFAVTFADITERVEAAAAAESENIGRAIMASANEPVIVCDAHGRITHATEAVRLLRADPVLGERFGTAFPLKFAIGSGLMDADDLVAVALAGSAMRGIDATLPGADGDKDVLLSAAPLRLADAAVGGCVITMIDLSERKAVEAQQAFLVNELTHRVKNTLTLVSAISMRTIAGATSLDDFRDRFSRRLGALAATHDLLVQRKWSRLSLRDLVVAEVAPYLPPRSDRIVLEELDVSIQPRSAIALGLVIHELVTNAVKYGALSNEAGTVTVEAECADDGALEILWREAGGPPVRVPERTGFGQTLIARSLGSGPDAGATVEFRPDGVLCRMRIPAVDL